MHKVGQTIRLGPFSGEPDGTFFIGGIAFDQGDSFDKFRLGDAELTKAAGEGQPLIIRGPDRTHTLTFDGGVWFYQSERRGLVARVFGF
jgi:hypothetical protein